MYACFDASAVCLILEMSTNFCRGLSIEQICRLGYFFLFIVLSLTHFHHIQSIDNNIQSRNETEIIWSSFLLEQDSHSQLKRIQNIFGWTAPTSRPAFTPLAPVWEKLTKAYSVRLSSTEAHESFNLNKQKNIEELMTGGLLLLPFAAAAATAIASAVSCGWIFCSFDGFFSFQRSR